MPSAAVGDPEPAHSAARVNWQEEDAASFGEGVPRCNRAGCRAPLELSIGATLILERCSQFHHVQHVQLVYPEEFQDAE